MLEVTSLAACGWLLMHNPTENLRPIAEWKQLLAFDTATECKTFIAMRWVKAKKEHDEFKLERYRCAPPMRSIHTLSPKNKTIVTCHASRTISSEVLAI